MSQAEPLTERLSLSAPVDEDHPHYRELLLAPQVSRWLRPAPLPAFSDPDPALWLARDIAHWRKHGFGPWVVRERHSKRFIGRAGLGYSTVHRDTVVEVAWAILPSLWGNGLASESASRALALAQELGLGEVVSFTLPANAASRRVMEKIGLEFDCQIQRAGIPHVLYRSGCTPSPRL